MEIATGRCMWPRVPRTGDLFRSTSLGTRGSQLVAVEALELAELVVDHGQKGNTFWG